MKYIIDVPDNAGWIEYHSPVNGDNSHFKGTIVNIDQMEIYTEPDRKAIEDEVWKFATICTKMDGADSVDVFGGFSPDSFTRFSYQQAKARYEAWKRQKDEIRLGNEVIYHGDKYVVGYIGTNEVYHLVNQHWFRNVVQGKHQLLKTGRHFPEVEELLKKMKE